MWGEARAGWRTKSRRATETGIKSTSPIPMNLSQGRLHWQWIPWYKPHCKNLRNTKLSVLNTRLVVCMLSVTYWNDFLICERFNMWIQKLTTKSALTKNKKYQIMWHFWSVKKKDIHKNENNNKNKINKLTRVDFQKVLTKSSQKIHKPQVQPIFHHVTQNTGRVY